MVGAAAKVGMVAAATLAVGFGAWYLVGLARGGGGGGGGNGPVATACAVAPSGACGQSATYTTAQAISVRVTVPTGASPVSLVGYVGGVTGSVLPWDVATTGLTYTVSYGAMGTEGTYSAYYIVTFSDGSTYQTDMLTLTVTSAAPGGGGSSTLLLQVGPSLENSIAITECPAAVCPPGAANQVQIQVVGGTPNGKFWLFHADDPAAFASASECISGGGGCFPFIDNCEGGYDGAITPYEFDAFGNYDAAFNVQDLCLESPGNPPYGSLYYLVAYDVTSGTFSNAVTVNLP